MMLIPSYLPTNPWQECPPTDHALLEQLIENFSLSSLRWDKESWGHELTVVLFTWGSNKINLFYFPQNYPRFNSVPEHKGQIRFHRYLVRNLASDSPKSSSPDLSGFQPLRRNHPQSSPDHSSPTHPEDPPPLSGEEGLRACETHPLVILPGCSPVSTLNFILQKVFDESKLILLFLKHHSAPCACDVRSIHGNLNFSLHPSP